MALDVDQEILQDFLVEAGEILEQLSEQLVELEMRPNDSDLLNAIFRGFHTVKGGAGFLSLSNMVDICHVSENVFDILRNGEREVTADLMDVVLKALDTVNSMFEEVRANEEPSSADQALLDQLEVLATPAGNSPAEPVAAEPTATPEPMATPEPAPTVAPTPTPTPTPTTPTTTASDDGDISEDEFENLLDELHGQGGSPGIAGQAPAPAPAKEEKPKVELADAEDITEDDFEDLLDSLHGIGSAPGTKLGPSNSALDAMAAEEPIATAPAAAPTPDPAPTPAPAPTPTSAVATPKPAETPQPAAKQPAASPAPKAEPKPAAKPAPPAGDAAKKPAEQQAAAQGETTVRVDTSRLDDIMNMVGELVLVRNRLVTLGSAMHDENMVQAVANLDVVTADLQMAVMKTRMQPIKKVFGRFPRVVRDLARSLKKDIVLEMVGEETDLDKNLVEALADPLVHLVRNSVDHGIEMPDAREQVGKSRTGTVILAAEQAGDHILLSIKDDGAGMDPDKLRANAVNKGLMDRDAADRLSEKECFNLIFMPGFSTKQEISDISGRGVGMDVVKTKITQLNGSVDIDSVLGEGTRLSIKVPLTLAILPTLMVILGEQTFALPLTSVNEIFHLDLTNTNVVDGQLTVIVREKALPLFYLKHWLVSGAETEKPPREGHVVIVSVGTQRIGFVVDQLVGQEEVVIKPLGSMLHGTPGMAGATITGDGNIAMILDIPSLLSHYARRV